MQAFKVIFYSKDDGAEPAKDFILGLDKKMRAKILLSVDLLAETDIYLENLIQNLWTMASLS